MLESFTPQLAAAWAYFLELAIVLIPLFIGGSFLVGLLQEYVPPDRVERILTRYDGGSGNLAAAGVGALTPFCSCSTVPVLAALLGAGTPLGTAVSFLLASPLVNELAIILLAGLFGLEVTAGYVLLTVSAAVAGGIVIGRLGLEDHVKVDQHFTSSPSAIGAETDDPTVCCDGGVVQDGSDGAGGCGGDEPNPSNDSDCATAPPPATHTTHTTRVRSASHGATAFFVDLLPYLVVGMTLGALIHGFVPAGLLTRILGPENDLAVPLAAIAGAPIYVSMSAMLPVAATFADQGIPIGTVLAFVVGSAGVSIPNLILLNKLFDRTLLAVYAVTVVTTAIVVGVLFNALLV